MSCAPPEAKRGGDATIRKVPVLSRTQAPATGIHQRQRNTSVRSSSKSSNSRHHACTVIRCKDVAKGTATSGGGADQRNDTKVHHSAAAGPSTQDLLNAVEAPHKLLVGREWRPYFDGNLVSPQAK